MKAIITAICLLASVLLAFFGVWPEYQDLRENLVKAEVTEENLSNKINYNQVVSEMATWIEEDYDEEISRVATGLPEDHYIPSLFSTLRNLATQSGLEIEQMGEFSVASHEEYPEIRVTEFEFVIVGSYQDFREFIIGLKNTTRLIGLRALNIEMISEEEVEFRVIFETYSY